MDLGIDARFAHPAGNELGHLTAEIDNKNAVSHDVEDSPLF